jgi:type IV pilus assembly protein PilW
MQAFILLRSQETDPGYINEKTYRLGDITLAPADDIRRLMMQTEITLRNPRLVLRGGA